MVSIALPFSSQKINIAGRKVPVIYLIGGIGAVVLGYFLLSKKDAGQQAGQPPLVAVAPDVIFTTNPTNISPPNPFSIMGQFQTLQGQPVTVKQGYYYVFTIDSVGGKRLISQGSVGIMVSRFNIMVQTMGWQAGKYSVVVTDVPMTPQELQSQGAQNTAQGQVAGNTYGTTTAPVQPGMSPLASPQAAVQTPMPANTQASVTPSQY